MRHVWCLSAKTNDLRPDIRYIADRFNYFNRIIFNGDLPNPEFKITRARRYYGLIRVRKISPGRRIFTISISGLYERDPEAVDDTLIHEMIHYHIFYRNLRDTSSHGKIFCKIMNEINARHGRHIRVSSSPTQQELESDRRVKVHIGSLVRLQGGQTCAAFSPNGKMIELDMLIRSRYNVAEMKWFLSRNAYFNRFPRSTAGRLYKIDHDEFARNLADAKWLRIENGKVTHA